jgi:hypothetical protein
MIRGGSGHMASQFELVTAAAGGLFAGKALFCIADAPGIWRKVADPKVSDPSDRGIVVAQFGGGKIFLMYDAGISAELAEAGVGWRCEDESDGRGPDDISAAIAKAKELAKSEAAGVLTGSTGAATAPEAAPARRRGRPARAQAPAALPSMSGVEGSIVAPIAAEHASPVVAPSPTPAPAPPPPEPAPTGFSDVGELDI